VSFADQIINASSTVRADVACAASPVAPRDFREHVMPGPARLAGILQTIERKDPRLTQLERTSHAGLDRNVAVSRVEYAALSLGPIVPYAFLRSMRARQSSFYQTRRVIAAPIQVCIW